MSVVILECPNYGVKVLNIFDVGSSYVATAVVLNNPKRIMTSTVWIIPILTKFTLATRYDESEYYRWLSPDEDGGE
ncbi:predicted protein [Sclerotinia sclerotiorum 1980 UF-70]|uniref:Uncharacterized protein n=1 Tax=Sclerotinia sclerotiorum (strain ATCC 18683 / 1980 / Ss-1) TaxID=665079 RepID=A7EWM0_SCLS1|nr:predicted protein [Sclerotinia sclerotiorum 1980 UF-70]EDN93862.1 predicted protein [Sclerotinia sclerotiorum 1980 UF-70]